MIPYDVLELILSVTAGAGIGSIVATRITYWQLERKFGFNLEELGEDIEKIREVLNDWHEFSDSEEAEILADKFVGTLDNLQEISIQAKKNPLLNPEHSKDPREKNSKGGENNDK